VPFPVAIINNLGHKFADVVYQFDLRVTKEGIHGWKEVNLMKIKTGKFGVYICSFLLCVFASYP